MTASSPVYVAPATEPLTVLHIRDAGKPFTSMAGDGRTACDRELAHAECWQVVELRPGDRICSACLGQPEPEIGALF